MRFLRNLFRALVVATLGTVLAMVSWVVYPPSTVIIVGMTVIASSVEITA